MNRIDFTDFMFGLPIFALCIIVPCCFVGGVYCSYAVHKMDTNSMCYDVRFTKEQTCLNDPQSPSCEQVQLHNLNVRVKK